MKAGISLGKGQFGIGEKNSIFGFGKQAITGYII
jgi:hypothetical protein